MSEVVEVNCYINKGEENKFTLLPRTGLDAAALNSFLDSRGRYVTVRLMHKAASKSYEQQKAFWSLASLHFRAYNGKAPTSSELQYWYEDLLKPTLFPVRIDTVSEGKFKPKGFSELTKAEAIEVISKMLQLVADIEGVPDDIAANCKDLFEWLEEQKKEQAQEDTIDNATEDLASAVLGIGALEDE